MSESDSVNASAPEDQARAARNESLTAREQALTARGSAAEARETALSERDDAAALREEALRAREECARAYAELDVMVEQLRDANEHLVLATVRSQTLSEQANQLAAIVESSDDAIYSKSLEGIVTSWNKAAEQMYGYRDEEIIGAPVAVLVPPDQADEVPRVLERLSRGETTERLETVRVRKDGTYLHVALTISPIKDDEGRVVAASTIARDITARKLAEEERAELLRREHEAREAAEAANRLKDEFLAVVSHELRTPLNAVLGWARMTTSRNLEGQSLAHALETIERNAAGLALIIDDLLDVSRVVAGRLELLSEPVDLVAVARAAIDVIRPVALEKGIDLQFSPDPDAGELVTGDPGRLRQVIDNLLVNAIKFTPGGGRVEVSARRVNAAVQVSVSDTGEGIDAAFLPFVFDRFRQADAGTARQHAGLGLGLSIVRQLVERHGGTVHAASDGKGRGATFTVELPIRAAHATGAAPTPAEKRGGHSPSPQSGDDRLDDLHVLVVDDDEDNRTLTALLLTQRGATVSAVASGREAVQLYRVEPPDILVTDIGLPDLDGYGLLREVRERQSPHGRFVPAIALTGYGGSETRQRVFEAGFQSHIVKPFDAAELVMTVAALAGRAQKG